ncbi:M10 family metallopeptidase C-terminal domain-containing protein [Phenylobacterium sp. 20VBR1]|uniref:M10 family metallopeptidase C-terminal domain-containing protein n=1 Tax=Phenylobacterium glaciei TaxID=2803784 RepID=A0A941HXI2_9CAUL|nr:matrixin family metalloprotease [Phenylobacterium glaciei]MBR7620958.1 M10 family metallopeptidase C-terminal domain-containing protein [Phenylobacterium glaciei]
MTAPTITQITAALLDADGSGWTGGTVTYSFPRAGSTWPSYTATDEPANAAYSTPTDAQDARFRLALDAWDKITALTFVETDDLANTGQIRIAFTNVEDFAPKSAAYAYYPPTPGYLPSPWEGDVWLDDSLKTEAFADRSFAYATILHELGHSLGLKHPFEEGATLPTAYDNNRYSVMSYKLYQDAYYVTVEQKDGGFVLVGRAVGPTTPMVFDIAAAQARYGADPNTAAGNTTYTWSQATPIMQAIYDAGGNDTFDLSSHTRSSIIDLTPGAYSSIAYYSAQAQADYWNSLYTSENNGITTFIVAPETYTWSNNLGIAYGTVIENVLGGSASDTILGNDAGNYLNGGAGNDFLRGFLGDDSIVGGDGFDDTHGNQGNDTVRGGNGPDWVVGGQGNDLLFGDAGDDLVYGNLGNDTQEGGDGVDWVRGGQGDDSLSGGAGDDWMSGDLGDDTLSGGSGADTFRTWGGTGIDRVTDFNRAQGDRVQLDIGTVATASQVGADTVIDMVGGGKMILVGVSMASLDGGWIFAA